MSIGLRIDIQINGKEYLKIDPNVHGELISTKMSNQFNGEKSVFSKVTWKQLDYQFECVK